MKKILLTLVIGLSLISCTENTRVKTWGGTGTIELPKGEKLINITWKEGQVWYLTRPMNINDSVQTYKFQEHSSFGMVEGTYIVVESK